MANEEHLHILKQGVEIWNEWKQEHKDVQPDLSWAELDGSDLGNINFDSVNLHGARFVKANLDGASFHRSRLSNTVLTAANLRHAKFYAARLHYTVLFETDLSEAHLGSAFLKNVLIGDTNFNQSIMGDTIFVDTDLRSAKRLDTVKHEGPSSVGIDTIYRSQGKIPEIFLRGAGVPDSFITYIHSLVGKALEYYSCFISYSSKDDAFARRLYADLQNNNVRCWYAPEDLKIGDKFRHRIDESIRIYDKLLLVLSEASLASTWVSYEVEKALNKEPEGVPNVLFPIRLDNAILTCETDWAKDVRKSRHIGDFEHWKDHDAYQIAFERLLRDLKAQS